MSEQWYTLKNGLPLEQGDILKEAQVVVPSHKFLTGATQEVGVATADVVILTQSCDLAHHGKTNWVQVAKLIDIKELFPSYPSLSGTDRSKLNAIIKGYTPNYHMIEECNIGGYTSLKKIIDFREVFNLPIEYVQELAIQQEFISLNSPYKEHLSQAYARFYMRVGLPTNIPLFSK